MRNVLITLIAFMMSVSAASAETLEDYLTPDLEDAISVGHNADDIDPEHPDYFELLSDNVLNLEDISDEQITGIVFYMAKNHNRINGIKIEYAKDTVNGPKEVGSTRGNSNRKNFGEGEYVNEIKIFGKDSDSSCQESGSKVTKVRMKTKYRTEWFGKDRGSDCSQSESRGEGYRLIGLRGIHTDRKVVALAPIWLRNVDLTYDRVELSERQEYTESEHLFFNEIILNDQPTPWETESGNESSFTGGHTNSWEETTEKTETLGAEFSLEIPISDVTLTLGVTTELSEMNSTTVGEESFVETSHTISSGGSTEIDPWTIAIHTRNITVTNKNMPYTLVYKDLNNCDDDGACHELYFEGTLTDSTEVGVVTQTREIGYYNDNGDPVLFNDASEADKDKIEHQLEIRGETPLYEDR